MAGLITRRPFRWVGRLSGGRYSNSRYRQHTGGGRKKGEEHDFGVSKADVHVPVFTHSAFGFLLMAISCRICT